MSLILVIVADPHEAAQLATLIQGRLPVDLVQAAEVGEGLLSLEDRIPDLILTSPLMSPFDDGVLDEYLRDLGPAGAHVQTLRIPVLSQAPKKAKRLGFSLRRSKPEAPTIDGCEPKVFVDEIEQYLARATEEKLRAASSDQAPVIIEQEEVAEPIAEEQWTAAYSEEEPVVRSSWSEPAREPEPEPEPVAWRADLLDRPPVEETPIYQPSPVAYEEPAIEYAAEPTVQYEVEATVEHDIEAAVEYASAIEEEAIAVEEPVAVEPEMPVAVVEAIAEPTIEEVVEPETPVDAPVTAEPSKPAGAGLDEDKASPSFKAALAAIRAAWGKPARNGGSPVGAPESPAQVPAKPQPMTAAAETPASVEVDLTDVVEVLDEDPMDLVPRAVESRVDPVAETVEVYELSIEPDLNELDTQVITPVASPREPSAPKTVAAAPVVEEPKAAESASGAADGNGDRRKKSKRAPKSAKAQAPAPRQGKAPAAQNEWGVFDPNQCGFAALVDKLDEVADEKTKQPQNGTKARVISLS